MDSIFKLVNNLKKQDPARSEQLDKLCQLHSNNRSKLIAGIGYLNYRPKNVVEKGANCYGVKIELKDTIENGTIVKTPRIVIHE